MATNRPVGSWTLPPHVGSNRSTIATVQREFRRLRMLDHPNIERLFELGHNGEQYYVTGERHDGEPLREVLTHLLPERLEVGEADDIVRAVGSALAYAHEHGIAHGDVRAEHVLVTMDRRFVLTNFMARRVARLSSRPPRPADDVKGLARLAAELYTGSTSPRALRSALHGDVPAARLNAIRAVLESSSRRTGTVEEFLAAAGLAFSGGAVARRRARQRGSWSVWRVAWPAAAVAAIVALIASNGEIWGASAEGLKERGLDALRAVAERVVPAEPADAPSAEGTERAEQPLAVAENTEAPASPAGAELASAATPVEPVEAAAQPEPDTEPKAAPETAPEPEPAVRLSLPAAAQMARPAAPPPPEPAIVALALPHVAVREDHSAAAIDIVRRGDLSREITVSWWTVPGTAQPDEDYASIGLQTVTLRAGEASRRLLIPLVNDGVREPAESFEVHIGRPQGGIAGSVTTTIVTVHDDD